MEWKLYAYGRILYKDMFTPPSLLLPPPSRSPFKCDNKGSRPVRHFRPPLSPPLRIMDRFWQPRSKSRMASILETVSMIAEFGQQQWSCMNFRCNDRTLRSRDRIFVFSQEMVKIWAAAWISDTRANFDRSGRYNQPVQYRRDAAHESRVAWAIRSLEIYMSDTSTRIWTRALQPDQEEVSSLRFCRAQKVSGRQTFPPIFWLHAGILPRRGDFNVRQSPIERLNFYQAPIFCTRLNFVYPPNFHE